MNDKTPEQFFESGKAHYEQGEYNLAIVDFTKAIALKSDYAEAWYNRGLAHYDKGEYNLAIKDFTKAIDLKLDYAEAFYNRGMAYASKGEYREKSIVNYSHALTDYTKAIADYTKAIDLKLDYAEAFYHRGKAYKIKNQYFPAIADYTRAIKLKPDYADAFYNRGVSYRATDKKEEALKDFKRAIQLDPTLVIQEETKEIKDQVKEIGGKVQETENFQSIFERLEKNSTSPEKGWFWGAIFAVIVTLAIIVMGLPALLSWIGLPAFLCWIGLPPLDSSNFPDVNPYAIYVFCSVVTMIIIRQYTNAKQLRIEASHRLAMAKIFTHTNRKNTADYKEFTLPIIRAIANSMDKTQTQNSNELLALIERLANKK